MGRKLGDAGPPFASGSWSPSNTMWAAKAHLHTKWHLDPSCRLATIDMGQKVRVVVPHFWEQELGPHLTQCCLGLGLPPYQVESWSIQPFVHNRYGPKIGDCAPLGEGELGPHLTQCGHAEAYLHAKFHLDPSTVWPQYTNVTDRTDRHAVPWHIHTFTYIYSNDRKCTAKIPLKIAKMRAKL